MVHPAFQSILSRHYEFVKARYPNESKKRWQLRALYENWSDLTNHDNPSSVVSANSTPALETDPLDWLSEGQALGLIIRTDFTNDTAWANFVETFNLSQKELISELRSEGETDPPNNVEDVTMQDGTENTQEDHDEDSISSDGGDHEIPEIVKIIDGSTIGRTELLENISNIIALRIFDDLDVRRAPEPPNRKQTVSQHPLIYQEGWQEIYSGKNLWIYDTQSNLDGCVRVVSQTGDFYGTATGDSWRARVNHICELQFGLSYQGLQINFNGLDKWDFNERTRNLRESVIGN